MFTHLAGFEPGTRNIGAPSVVSYISLGGQLIRPGAPPHLRAGAFAPKTRPLPFNLQRLPNPDPTNPPQRQRSPMPAIANYNRNVSAPINAAETYFPHA
jgi:hypothetical protein